jgi:hypothetical protein
MSPLFAKLPTPEELPALVVIVGFICSLLFFGVVLIGKWLTYVIDGPADRRRTRR